MGRRLESDGSKTATRRTWQSYSLGRQIFSKRWSLVVMLRFFSDMLINVAGQKVINIVKSSEKEAFEVI